MNNFSLLLLSLEFAFACSLCLYIEFFLFLCFPVIVMKLYAVIPYCSFLDKSIIDATD